MKSPELRELEAEQSELEPSLDKMLDLDDPKTQQALKEWVQSILDEKREKSLVKPKGQFPTAKEYAEHLAGRSLSPEEIQPVNTYTARGPTGQSMK